MIGDIMKRGIQVVEEKHFQFSNECLDILIAVDDVHYLLSRRCCFICKKWFWCVSSIIVDDEKIHFCGTKKKHPFCICPECSNKRETCYGVYVFQMSNPILRGLVACLIL